MIEFIREFLVEIIVAIVFLFFTNLFLYIRKLQKEIQIFKKEQKEIDEAQDRLLDEKKQKDAEQDLKMQELEFGLKRKLDREEYFEKQRLLAYPKIRKYAQQARDEVRLIDTPSLMPSHRIWLKNLEDNYHIVLELLHENALLLKHFNHYKAFHDFKNALLNFFIAAKENIKRNFDKSILLKDYEEIKKCWNVLEEQIEFPDSELHLKT